MLERESVCGVCVRTQPLAKSYFLSINRDDRGELSLSGVDSIESVRGCVYALSGSTHPSNKSARAIYARITRRRPKLLLLLLGFVSYLAMFKLNRVGHAVVEITRLHTTL